MPEPTPAVMAESRFAGLIDAATPARREEVVELLREDHPLYTGQGGAAVVRMRGWALLGLARVGLPPSGLVYVLEELDTGTEPYLVAAAARALRTSPQVSPSFAPFLLRGINNVRYREEEVSFDSYGETAGAAGVTSPLTELLAALAWLGPVARGVLPDIDALRSQTGGLPRAVRDGLGRIADGLRSGEPPNVSDCCALPPGVRWMTAWGRGARACSRAVDRTAFEDHDGRSVTFAEYFRGRPTVVVFFYTRCDNPQKCSLTVTKLARVQSLLDLRGLGDRVRTAGITYDPEYDSPPRLCGYGLDRGVRLGDHHRLFRTVGEFEPVRRFFRLGVNFLGSLVNRHRLDVVVLDSRGRIAARYERLHWKEEDVVDRAAAVLAESTLTRRGMASLIWGSAASLGVAFFPKCPVCWAAYLGVFGVAGVEAIPYAPWILPVLAVLLLVNVVSVGFRSVVTGRLWPFGLVAAGAVAILGCKVGLGWDRAAVPGVVLTLIGSVASALVSAREPHLLRETGSRSSPGPTEP